MAKYTLIDFGQQFPDDDACLLYLFKQRYGQHGPLCACGKRDTFHRVAGRRSFACAWCGAQISPTAGTIFDHSPTPLTLWFFAMFLMCANKNGVAALELKRQLGVTYKTAWRMAHAIRKLMEDDTDPDKLKGTVEGDETYWGGKTTGGKRGRGAPNKTPIVGYVERDGRVRVHTNTIEGFWSQLKRSIDGTHHQVSRRWLHLYAAEHAWRYSHRRSTSPLLLRLLSRAAVAPTERAA